MRVTLVCFLLTMLLAGCQPSAENKPLDKPLQYHTVPVDTQLPVYRWVPHPLYNPLKLSETLQPLVDYLNRQVPGANLQLETSRDYQAFEKKFRARDAEFLMPNPWQTLEAQKVGYHVIAMWGDAADFKGIFIVRKDSGIQVPADLKGKVVSYPSPTALAAAIMPQYYLHQHGIDINKDIQNNYVGSQGSSIINAYLGQSDVGATWPPPWRLFLKDHPVEAAQLKVIWETPSLINNSVMARDDVPDALRQGIRQALLDLPNTPEGVKILAGMETGRFHAAEDTNYEIVRDFIKRFEEEVRPVDRK